MDFREYFDDWYYPSTTYETKNIILPRKINFKDRGHGVESDKPIYEEDTINNEKCIVLKKNVKIKGFITTIEAEKGKYSKIAVKNLLFEECSVFPLDTKLEPNSKVLVYYDILRMDKNNQIHNVITSLKVL